MRCLWRGGRECTKSGGGCCMLVAYCTIFSGSPLALIFMQLRMTHKKDLKMYFHLTRAEIRQEMKNVRRKVSVLNHRAGQTLQQNTKEAQSSLFLTSLSLNCSRLRRMSPRWQHLEKAPGAGSCTTCTRGHQPGGWRGKSCFNFNRL